MPEVVQPMPRDDIMCCKPIMISCFTDLHAKLRPNQDVKFRSHAQEFTFTDIAFEVGFYLLILETNMFYMLSSMFITILM